MRHCQDMKKGKDMRQCEDVIQQSEDMRQGEMQGRVKT